MTNWVGVYSHHLNSPNSMILAADVNDCVLHVAGAISHLIVSFQLAESAAVITVA